MLDSYDHRSGKTALRNGVHLLNSTGERSQAEQSASFSINTYSFTHYFNYLHNYRIFYNLVFTDRKNTMKIFYDLNIINEQLILKEILSNSFSDPFISM